jgi:hypothetical protein
MRSCFLLLFFLISFYQAESFDKLLFTPLTANVFEPRIGSSYQFSNEKLRLDIGASFDLADIDIFEDVEMRFGTDFFTFTRLRSEGGFKFPVETSDYFFGINFSAIRKLDLIELSSRLRIAHISAHLVDGYATGDTFHKPPFVYSREFTDLVLAAKYDIVRFYFGWQMIFSTIPKDFEINNYQLGFDLKQPVLSFVDLIGGYDLRLIGIDSQYSTVHSLQAGLYVSMSERAGISIDYNYYEGKSIHGLFYKDKDIYSSLGFRVIYYY